MRLDLKEKFTLEIENEDDIVGFLKPFSKQDKKDFKKQFEKNKLKNKELRKESVKLQRLNKKIESASDDKLDDLYSEFDEVEDKVNLLSDDLNDMDTLEEAEKTSFDKRVESDKLSRLVEICEIVGYKKVMETIHKDIEKRVGNDETA